MFARGSYANLTLYLWAIPRAGHHNCPSDEVGETVGEAAERRGCWTRLTCCCSFNCKDEQLLNTIFYILCSKGTYRSANKRIMVAACIYLSQCAAAAESVSLWSNCLFFTGIFTLWFLLQSESSCSIDSKIVFTLLCFQRWQLHRLYCQNFVINERWQRRKLYSFPESINSLSQ